MQSPDVGLAATIGRPAAARDRNLVLAGLGRAGRAMAIRQVPFQQDIRGFQVAVDDAVPMGVVQRVGHLGRQFRGLSKAEPFTLEPFGQAWAVDQLGDDVDCPLIATAVMDGDDSAVPKLGRGAGLAQEPLFPDVATKVAAARQLDGDLAAKLLIAGAQTEPNPPVPSISPSS